MSMLRPLLLSLAWLVSAATLAAPQPAAPDASTTAPPAEERAPRPPPAAPRSAPKPTFTPTEKIQADRSVSFPVDI